MADDSNASTSQTSTPKDSTSSTAPGTSEHISPASSAPTTTTTAQTAPHSDGTKPIKQISCIQCQQRKIKCNKTSPCSHCAKSRLECVYRPPAPPRRGGLKRKTPTTEADLLARLRRCEELLRGAGVEVDGEGNVAGSEGAAGQQKPGADEGANEGEKLPGLASLVSDRDTYGHALVTASSEKVANQGLRGKENVAEGRSDDAANAPTPDRGRVMVEENGKHQYIESELWNSIGTQKTSSKDLSQFNDDSQKSWRTDQDHLTTQGQGDGAFIFEAPLSRVDLYDLHPSQEDVKILWGMFKDNIDPLSKVVHTPTLGTEILEASKDPRNLPENLEALMFAVYASAVVSSSPTECEEAFGVSRSIMTARFGAGAKKAFINAGILMTSDFRLLQAFVLWLLSVRQSYDPRALWTLTGVALRLGQRQGLHREKALKAVSVFEAEMRRRLWWQIMILDSRAAELSGSGVSIFVNLFDTDVPRNLNDLDLHPGIKELPPERTGATDMIFVALRSELGVFLRRSMPTSAGGNAFTGVKDVDIDKFEQILEQKYLRFCDALYPVQLLTSIVGRAALTTIRLITHHPSQYSDGGASMPQEEKNMLFSLSLRLIKYDQLIRATKVLSKFLWHCDAYFPWHAFIYLLSYTSSKDVTKEKCVMAWEAIQHVFDANSHIVTDIKKPLHVAIGNLTLKAWEVNGEHYSGNTQRQNSVTSGSSPQTPQSQDQNQDQRPLPYFISVLRAQRASRTTASHPGPNKTSTLPRSSSTSDLSSSINSSTPAPLNRESTFFNTSLHTWPHLKTSSPTPNPAIAAARAGSNSDMVGVGTGSFFTFMPPPTALNPHLKNKNQIQSKSHSPAGQGFSLSPAPQQAATFPSNPAFTPDLGPISSAQDPMTIESMDMGIDMGSMDWQEWDRLLAQDFDSMLPAPTAAGYGMAAGDTGGLWRDG